MTRASVLIPIHNKPTTLPLAVDTVLKQTVNDLEVILIGDGITDELRTVVTALVAADSRVRFLDFPKGPHHGERYRHHAIEAAESEAIFYLCDDDLLLPNHVADLLALLEEHDLVQSLNCHVTPSGDVRLYAADLADAECIDLHLSDEVQFSSISITGTAHTRQAYDATSDPWDTTPSGEWPDHWQFRKLMRQPGFRGATSSRVTALQFPTSADQRDSWNAAERLAEIEPWHQLVISPDAQVEIDRRTQAGMLAQLIEDRSSIALAHRDLAWCSSQLAVHQDELAQQNLDNDQLRGQLSDVEHLYQQALDAERLLRAQLAECEDHTQRLIELRSEREATIHKLRAMVLHKNDTIARLRARIRRRA